MPVGGPYSDQTPENGLIIPRGSFGWLQSALVVNGVLAPPDAATFTTPGITAILDPDGNDVSPAWLTAILDAGDVLDTYSSASPTYVGNLASPPNVGLFHDGGGHLASKVKVPTGTEITTGNASRHFTVRWRGIKKNGQTLPDRTESFNVADAGVIVFGAGIVTAAQVRAGFETQLLDSDLQDIIGEAAKWVRGKLVNMPCNSESDTTKFTSLPDAVSTAIIEKSRSITVGRDASGFRRTSRLKEGSLDIGFSGMKTDMITVYNTLALEALKDYCGIGHPRKPVMRVTRQDTTGFAPGKFVSPGTIPDLIF